jgi:hypothetical protein
MGPEILIKALENPMACVDSGTQKCLMKWGYFVIDIIVYR